MGNYSIKTNLLKVQGAFVTNLKGKTTTKRCLVIPVDASGMFLGEKGCYLNMTAIEMNESRYGDSHCLKVDVPKEQRQGMTEEELRAVPIIGGMHPLVSQAQQMAVMGQLDATVVMNEDDLPF